MNKICDAEKCTGCGACAAICPRECIQMLESDGGFYYPSINDSACINCGACENVCPVTHKPLTGKADFFIGWHRNYDVVKKSSSGGIFSAIAELILLKGGVVAGAYLDKKTNIVSHIIINSKEQLDMLRMSKYYQSNMDNIYKIVKECLLQQRYVLFTGTACQCAAMKNFLRQYSESQYLVTADVLCHGVTSKAIVDSYIKSKEKQYKREIVSYSFRVKGEDLEWQGGGGTRVKLQFTDGTDKIEDRLWDTFFVGFNHNLILRESCYVCNYTGTERVTDFTLADFWGATLQDVGEEQLKNGVSAFTINSDKGSMLFEKLKDRIWFKKVDQKKVTSHNMAFIRPQQRPAERDYIMNELKHGEYDKVIYSLRRKYYLALFAKRMLKSIIGEKLYKSLEDWHHLR